MYSQSEKKWAIFMSSILGNFYDFSFLMLASAIKLAKMRLKENYWTQLNWKIFTTTYVTSSASVSSEEAFTVSKLGLYMTESPSLLTRWWIPFMDHFKRHFPDGLEFVICLWNIKFLFCYYQVWASCACDTYVYDTRIHKKMILIHNSV